MKHPRLTAWPSQATTAGPTIMWWTWPTANIGIVTDAALRAQWDPDDDVQPGPGPDPGAGIECR
jgi:hypothetical protein